MLGFLAYSAQNLRNIGQLRTNYKAFHGEKGAMKTKKMLIEH